jgi:hypothetical protein
MLAGKCGFASQLSDDPTVANPAAPATRSRF